MEMQTAPGFCKEIQKKAKRTDLQKNARNSYGQEIVQINQATRGWINYYAFGSMKTAMTEIEAHLRAIKPIWQRKSRTSILTWIRGEKFWVIKYIEKRFCICYNANRQKEMKSPCWQRNESPNRMAVQFGDSSFLLWWQSTARLFVALVVTVQPFDDIVASYTSRNSDKKQMRKWAWILSLRWR